MGEYARGPRKGEAVAVGVGVGGGVGLDEATRHMPHSAMVSWQLAVLPDRPSIQNNRKPKLHIIYECVCAAVFVCVWEGVGGRNAATACHRLWFFFCVSWQSEEREWVR